MEKSQVSELAQENSIPSYKKFQKKTCRYCDTALPKAFLDLGIHPLANSLPKFEDRYKEEFKCPLALVKCPHCHLVQLTHVVPADLMFKDYLYVSSTTKTFRKHFSEYAKTVKEKVLNKEKPVAVDIGSNDGLLVSHYIEEGMQGVGVDPAENLAKEANARGLPTLNRYFDKACVKEIIEKYGKADAISGNNVFAHIDDIQSVCRNVTELLTEDGFFVIEFPYLGVMLKKLYFDMIYHEHVSYIGLHALNFLMNRFELEIFDIQEVSSHGGSLRVFSQKKGGPRKKEAIVDALMKKEKKMGCLKETVYKKFASEVLGFRRQLLEMLQFLRDKGETISGYGAPAKATTIINFCGLTPKLIDFIVDDNPLKQERFVPGGRIPIVSSHTLRTKSTDYVLIFAWNFAKEIILKLELLKKRGVHFIVPLPKPKIL